MNSSLRNIVAKDILERIRTGEFSSDMIITEAMICDILSLSRTPVREALIELTARGILERVPRKGYKIKEFEYEAKENVYVILGDLDALAARLALPHMDECDFLRMGEITDLIDIAIKYENYANYCELQEKFHHVYIDKCHNPLLIDTLEEIKASVTRYLYYTTNTPRLFEICAIMNSEHKHILQLFKDGDVSALCDYLENVHWLTKDRDLV